MILCARVVACTPCNDHWRANVICGQWVWYMGKIVLDLAYVALWRVFRHEIPVIAPHMLSRKKYNFDPMQLCLFSVTNTFTVFAFKIPFILTIYDHVAGIWISLITCNSTPFYPIETRCLPEIKVFYAENYHQAFTTSFLNFLSNAKFGHHIWRHNSSDIGWNKHQWEDNLSAYLPAKCGYIRWILLLFMA